MNRINCLIVDDEPLALEVLDHYISKVFFLNLVKKCQHAIEAMQILEENNIDLIFLDINMPDVDGLQFLKSIKSRPLVIFTTGYSQYAAEAFDLDAIDYVRKPIKLDRLKLAVKKVLFRLGKRPAIINLRQLNTDKGKAIVNTDQIGYIATSETDSRDKVAYYPDGIFSFVLKNISIARLLEILPAGQFCQVNKKELIALRSVNYFSHDTITTKIIQSDGIPLVLILSDTYRKEFIQLVQL
jgi:DNA-binding LytR/AlgR family response regulator